MDYSNKAALFKQLHQQPEPLRLPNAWDAGSALLIERLGAQAIATTSAGIAWSLGFRDGDALPIAQHVGAITAIARVISVPLSVDIESGYLSENSDIGETVARFMDAGAVGINIQDGAASPDLLCKNIEIIRATAERLGIELYINTRTDVYARGLVSSENAVQETLARAALYERAGADGLFVLGAVKPDEIREIAEGTGLLLNVITWPELPPVDQLGALGVRRVSVGSWIPQVLWAQTSALVADFLDTGLSEPLCEPAAPYSEVNSYFS